MSSEIISRQEVIPPFNQNAVAVKYIEYDNIYDEADITPELIARILKDIPEGVEIRLYLDPDGEGDFLEVLSDGEWLSSW